MTNNMQLITYLTVLFLSTEQISGSIYTKVFWTEIDAWGVCSTTCGPGIQQKRMVCVGQDMFKSIQPLNVSRCASPIEAPAQRTTRSCNLGECEYRYVWWVAGISACSQTCGHDGYRKRDIECHYIVRGNETVITDIENCPFNGRPSDTEHCNRFDCPAEFLPTKWGPCKKHRTDPCLPGQQYRKQRCSKTLASGEIKTVSFRACYTQMRHSTKKVKVPFYRNCYDYVNTKECITRNKKTAEITKSDVTVIQMRKAKRMTLQIGQTAYVIPWTRIIIRCPVNYFVPRQIQWQRGSGTTYEYRGRSLKERIRVDDKGRLKIRRFLVEDQGEWYCKAGETKASVILKIRSPSAGFHDWAHRNILWNEDMLNEDPKITLVKREVVQWVSTSWTKCSVSCGGAGIQMRTVNCERIDTRFYHVLDDKVCTEKLLPKPESKRVCDNGRKCPEWKLENVDKSFCTNKCSGLNKGTIKGNLTCSQQGQILPLEKCNPHYKPILDCENKMCQVKWKISDWSSCSQSCGSPGVIARHLTCVWLLTKEPAGTVCYDSELPIPEVIRPCIPPPCKLKCVDLSPHCNKRKDFCRFTIYRFQCCESCSGKV